MQPAPFGVPLAVFANHYAKAYARFAITFVAELMEANQLSLPRTLCARRCGKSKSCDSHQCGGSTHRKL
jgi:hypothetical protein